MVDLRDLGSRYSLDMKLDTIPLYYCQDATTATGAYLRYL